MLAGPLEKTKKQTAINGWHPNKEELAFNWIENEETIKNKKVVRGAIHFCQLGENIGNEQNEERPVIIISHNTINSTSGNVLIAPLSKSLKKKRNKQTGEIALTKDGKPIPKLSSQLFLFKDDYPFLTYDSAIMFEEIKSISKARLKDHIGTVTDSTDLTRINVRVKWSLGI
ncbi:type II toxin-antitoxin system PemK/MazF family toxin [Escherichia coli]|nr:type II toxin-antitoxin system PemK/MazF family toxin [Escherichia coli]